MDKYIYFKTNKFATNKDFSNWLHSQLIEIGETADTPIDNDYMFIIPVKRNGDLVNIYLGKNDEESNPPMWQAWPELKIKKIQSLFKKPNFQHENDLRSILEKVVNNIEDVTDIEWSNI